MRVEAIKKTIKYVLPTGECVVLVPGAPVALPDAAIQELRRKASAYITVHLDAWTDAFHDPAAPIQPGSFIVFRHNGVLRGGSDDGPWGQIVKVLRHEGQWKCFTAKGLIVAESSVRGVLAVNAHGQPIGAWTTRDHGLDGTTSRRTIPFQDLSPAQRQHVQARYGLSDALFTALATGDGSDEVWTQLWKGRA